MKKSVCIIAPSPYLVNGQSKAVDTILKSRKCNKIFNMITVDLTSSSKKYVSGKFAFGKIKNLFVAFKQLYHMQKQEQINVYYLTTAQSTVGCIRDIVLLSQILRKRDKAKIILHLHGGGFRSFYEKTNILLQKLIKKYYSKADVMIVLSEGLKMMFGGIIEESKIRIIGNCVDDEFICSSSEFEFKLENLSNKKTFILLYLSTMDKSKGYFDVLEAISILHKNNINIKITYAGDFVNQREKVEFFRYVGDNNLKNIVEYVGVVRGNAKKNLLIQSDIFVLPTYYSSEGQPIAMLEAMANGLPIVTTIHAGIPEIITNCVNGVFVEKRNPQSIADQISEMIKYPKIMVEIANNNRELIMEKHREKMYVENIIDLLSKC